MYKVAVVFSLLLLCCFWGFCAIRAETVFYSFVLKRVPSNPDGYPRSVIGVFNETDLRHDAHWATDRPFPGPTIRGRLGDTVRLKIKNGFDDVATSIHFHGLHMHNNPWMDGVADVTQPPIIPGHTFEYVFNLTHTGTFWYHSHSGVQYGDGLLGPIVVDYPPETEDPIKAYFLYASEHVLLLQDWYHENGDDLLVNYRGPYDAFRNSSGYPFIPNYPWRASSYLINGRGQFDCVYNNTCVNFWRSDNTHFPYNKTCSSEESQCLYARDPFFNPCDPSPHPLDEFQCDGRSVRLRLINGGTSLTVRFWIDQHYITVVARDGIEVIPKQFRSISLPVAQRLDIIVPCTQPTARYRIFVATAHTFLPHLANNPPLEFFTTAYFTYPNATKDAEILTPAPYGHGLPHCEPEDFEYQFTPLDKERRTTKGADHRIILQYSEAFDIYAGHPLEEWTINNITHRMPSSPILQEVFLGKSPSSTKAFHGTGTEGNLLETHLITLEHGKTYEVVMISMNPQQHPMHIHGYYLDFIATGTLDKDTDFYTTMNHSCNNQTRRQAIKEDVLEKKILAGRPLAEPAKVLTVGDSFTVPRMAFVVFRFTAKNQGPWLMHCHVEWHLAQGMALILSVERNGGYPDILPPTDDFPAYLPLKQFRSQSGVCMASEVNTGLTLYLFGITSIITWI